MTLLPTTMSMLAPRPVKPPRPRDADRDPVVFGPPDWWMPEGTGAGPEGVPAESRLSVEGSAA